jgi:hypothetical protein
MRFCQLAASLVFACGASALYGQTVAVDRIPPVHGSVLSGEKVDLPDALKGKVGVLVLGFSRASGDVVAEWGKRLSKDYNSSGAVCYYEVSVLEGVPGILRGYVVKKISEAVPDFAKSHFLPVLDHEKEWKGAAGFKSSDEVYVLVVDGTGVVRARVQGAPTDANFAEVKRQVDAVR